MTASKNSCLTVAMLMGALPAVFAQAPPPYVLRSIAGSLPLGDGGRAAQALLDSPTATVQDKSGTVYILDTGHGRIRRVTPDGIIRTLALVSNGADMTLDGDGNLLVATDVATIVRVFPDGKSTVIAGTGQIGSDGDGQSALLARVAPSGITWAPDGSIYFVESKFDTVRKIDRSGRVSTIAGVSRTKGFLDNVPAARGQLSSPSGLTLDAEGNMYVADRLNHRIRKISAADGIISTVAGNGDESAVAANLTRAATSPIGPVLSVAIDARKVIYFSTSIPFSASPLASVGADGLIRVGGEDFQDARIHVDATNTLWVSDTTKHRVLKQETEFRLSPFAGRSRFGGDGGPATAALLFHPRAVALGVDGTVYFSDTGNHRIRKIDLNGVISTVAGTGVEGFSGDGSVALAAKLSRPDSLAVDQGGNLYVADRGNFRVRKIGANGVIQTIAGSLNLFRSISEGMRATDAGFISIAGLALDRSGRVYISDYFRSTVWVVDSAGLIRTAAGLGSNGFRGDGGLAVNALLAGPRNLFVDAQGNLLVADTGNFRIRKVTPSGTISTLVGNGTRARPATGATTGGSTPIPVPGSMAQDPAGNLFLATEAAIYQITPGVQIFPIAGSGEALNTAAPFQEGASALEQALPGIDVSGLTMDRGGNLLMAYEPLNRLLRFLPNRLLRLEAVGGTTRTGLVGRAITEPMRVRVVGPEAGVSQVEVTFAVVSGEATPVTRVISTDAEGMAQVAVTLGPLAGDSIVRARAAGLSAAIDFRLTAVVPGVDGNPPEITVVPPVSVNAQVAITGRFFAVAGTDRTSEPSGGRLPLELAGVCVEFDGRPAALLQVKPQEITAIVPDLPGVQTEVTVITGCRAFNVSTSAAFAAAVKPETPEWLLLAAGDNGQRPIRITNEAGATIGAAKPGEVVTLWGTGFGPTDPAAIPGALAGDVAKVLGQAEVRIGNPGVAVSEVFYVGLAPGTAGGYVVVLRVPADLDTGDHPVVLRVGEGITPVGFVPVRKE